MNRAPFHLDDAPHIPGPGLRSTLAGCLAAAWCGLCWLAARLRPAQEDPPHAL